MSGGVQGSDLVIFVIIRAIYFLSIYQFLIFSEYLTEAAYRSMAKVSTEYLEFQLFMSSEIPMLMTFFIFIIIFKFKIFECIIWASWQIEWLAFRCFVCVGHRNKSSHFRFVYKINFSHRNYESVSFVYLNFV